MCCRSTILWKSPPCSFSSLNDMKKICFTAITAVLVVAIICLGGELLVYFLAPQAYLYPRLQFSADYGFTLYENTRMVNGIPGGYRFHYTVNEYGYRGIPIPPSPDSSRVRIVVLGDSYGFGIGVQDGEEFASVLRTELGEPYDVINLSVGGYGLTQQIRRYYEFGRLYRPHVVILQFCSNDPLDNLHNMVTEVVADSLRFHKTNNSVAWLKQYLSRSPIQQSQLYNFLRDRIYDLLSRDEIVDARINIQKEIRPTADSAMSAEQGFYVLLLETFSRALRRDGIRLIMISVNGHLDQFPFIRREVDALNARGQLEYVDVVPWFQGLSNFGSPEGHSWGSKAHSVIGTHLARIVRR